MDSEGAIIVLRLAHVLAGVFWVGAAVLMTFFTMPTVRAAGPVGGQFIGQFMQRTHYSRFMLGAAVITVLSGLVLYRDYYLGLAWNRRHPGPAEVFGLGGLIAILVALVANTAFPSITRRLGRITHAVSAQGAPTPAQAAERERLSRRLARLSTALASLLVVTTALMAVGRYV